MILFRRLKNFDLIHCAISMINVKTVGDFRNATPNKKNKARSTFRKLIII